MENFFGVQVRGCLNGRNVERCRPAFIWAAPEECRQFTIEIAKDSNFKHIIFLRDTHECYYLYDGAMLEAGQTYYVRVRSGAGAWSTTDFETAESNEGMSVHDITEWILSS